MAFMRIGIHTPSQGSLEKTALRAHELGANTFQIFTSSPRMWRASSLSEPDIVRLRAVREKLDLAPLVIHDNYLINLASADANIRALSVKAFRGELERAEAIGAEYLVAHPGNYKGISLADGLANFVQGVVEASRGLHLRTVSLLLECTAGAGSAIGSRFEELRAIREVASGLVDFPIGYCLDTCHLLASGFDIATEDGLRDTLRQAEAILGLANVKLIHANDSKAPIGSRRDRHENIGKGHIGLEGFRRILGHTRLRRMPFILETPVEQDGDDLRDIRTLKSLCPKSRTITVKSS
jgi:deoxyribonuclease IV